MTNKKKDTNRFYVYLHRRKDNNEVFYIGKGNGSRAYALSGRSLWWQRIVSKYGRVVEFVEKGLSESNAFDLEIELIKFYRDCGHEICNMTDGGEGASGGTVSQTTREKLALANTGKKRTEDAKRKMSENRPKQPVICSNGMEFESITSACRWVRNNTKFKSCDKSGVSACCNGILESSCGYRWRFLNNGIIDTSKHISSLYDPLPCIRYRISCSNGMIFNSIKDACSWLIGQGYHKVSNGSISSCCKGLRKTAYNFSWKYEEIVDSAVLCC